MKKHIKIDVEGLKQAEVHSIEKENSHADNSEFNCVNKKAI